MTDDQIAYVDSIHQRSPHAHTHLRSTGECLHREAGERCPTWQERAERAEAEVEKLRRRLTGANVEAERCWLAKKDAQAALARVKRLVEAGWGAQGDEVRAAIRGTS